MYYICTESFKEQHKDLVRVTGESALVEKIYFLGLTLINRRTESIFMADAPSCRYVSHYYILMLVNSEHNLNAIQDKIENNYQHLFRLQQLF